MDYGDEFNDDEERRYNRETYGDNQENAEEDEDGEFEQEESEESVVVPLAKEFSRRANRGNRMQALVDKA